jgi:hypothetical protein
MNILAEFGPHDLGQAWTYFKHWVKARPVGTHCAMDDEMNKPGYSREFIRSAPGAIEMDYDSAPRPVISGPRPDFFSPLPRGMAEPTGFFSPLPRVRHFEDESGQYEPFAPPTPPTPPTPPPRIRYSESPPEPPSRIRYSESPPEPPSRSRYSMPGIPDMQQSPAPPSSELKEEIEYERVLAELLQGGPPDEPPPPTPGDGWRDDMPLLERLQLRSQLEQLDQATQPSPSDFLA